MSDLRNTPAIFTDMLRQPSRGMTARERGDLCAIVRQQVRAAKAAAEQRAAQLVADFETQLMTTYEYDQDDVWKEAANRANQVVMEAQAAVAQRCHELGIPAQFAPSLSVSWYNAGQQATKQRRADLRRLAAKKIEAAQKATLAQIEQSSATIQTEIMAAGISSEEGRAFLERLPSVDALMPTIEVARIEALIDTKPTRY